MDSENNKAVNIDTNSLTENDSGKPADSGSDFKTTIIASVAIVLCAALVIFSLSSCFNKTTDANKILADKYSSGSSGGTGEAGDAFAPADNAAQSSDDTAVPADSADTSSSDTASAETPAQQDSPADSASSDSAPAQSGSSKSDSAAPSASEKAPSTKAEILNYFNTAINKVKPGAKSITQTLEKNYMAKSIDLGSLGVAKGVVNPLIEKNMGVNKDKTGITATTLADKNKIFPVENETWASKLTLDDIRDAKISESGGVYTITITIKDDAPAASITHGQGHHAKAVSVVMPQTIIDNAGGAKGFLKDLKVGNSDGKIVVKIDKATGHVTSASYDFVWSLGISMFGGITAYFGIIQEFSVKW